MVGSVWVELLRDLEEEAAEAGAPPWLRSGADELQAFMASRAAAWSESPFPFGSEMPWDSTGQEEVFVWATHFNYSAMAQLTLSAVEAYTPRVPHWGYAGNSRRYFDFIVYGGENLGTERLLHHYGSPLNAIPLLEAYRADPDDLYLLEIGIAGLLGSLTNIVEGSGVASMGWHGSEERLHRDPTSCDYGVGFFGVALNSGAYVVSGPAWKCYLCDLVHATSDDTTADEVTVLPRDPFRARFYFEPLGLDLQAEAGAFRSATLSLGAQTLVVCLETSANATEHVMPTKARLRLSAPALAAGHRSASGFVVSSRASGDQLPLVRGAFELSFEKEARGEVVIAWVWK